MRALLWLLGILLVLGVGVYLLDQVLVAEVERRTAEDIAETLGAATEVDLLALPLPVSVQLLLGEVRRVDVTATDVPLERGRVDRLDVTLERVALSWQDVDRDLDRLPPAEAGRFSAQLSEPAVVSLLGVPEGVVDVRLADGVATLLAAGFEVEADVDAREGRVVVVPRTPVADILGAGELAFDLSDQPGAPRAEEVEIADGVLTVRGVLEEVEGG